MKPINSFLLIITTISFLLLSGCEPTDGKLELKEPRKELSDMPERKNWLEIDITEESSDK